MIRAISFWKKPALEMTRKDMAKFLNRACNRKEVAVGLYKQGLTGNVTEKFIKDNFDFMFKADGKLNKEHKNILAGMLKNFGLTKKATLGDFFKISENMPLVRSRR